MRWLLLAAIPWVAAFGCSSGPRLVDVSGTVRFDGKPIAEGEIIFLAADNREAPVGGPITDGAFALRVTPGEKKVRINAVRKLDKRGAMGEPFVLEAYIPDRYNTATRLTATVREGDSNAFTFDLTP